MAIMAAIKSLAVTEILRFAPEYLAELIRHRMDRFDEIHGTHTNSAVSAGDIGASSANEASGELYWPVREKAFRRMMAAVPSELDAFCFVDVGCGKGRALLLASNYPFKRIIGVEYSPKLCDVARNNVALFCDSTKNTSVSIDVRCEDATEYEFPDQPLLIFFFDPFGADIMRRVIVNLNESLMRSPRPCFIVYHLPMHYKAIVELGYRVVDRQPRSLRLAYPWVVLQPVPDRVPAA